MDAAIQHQSELCHNLARTCMERLAAVLKRTFKGAQIAQVIY